MKLFYTILYFFIALISFRFSYADEYSMLNSGTITAPKKFSDLACIIIKLALDFVPYLVVIAVIAFMQGMIKYVGNGDNEEKRGEGRKMMVYGTLGFFFMVGIWGILKIFTSSFGVSLVIPQLKTTSSTFSC
jgi:hypothetical protein